MAGRACFALFIVALLAYVLAWYCYVPTWLMAVLQAGVPAAALLVELAVYGGLRKRMDPVERAWARSAMLHSCVLVLGVWVVALVSRGHGRTFFGDS